MKKRIGILFIVFLSSLSFLYADVPSNTIGQVLDLPDSRYSLRENSGDSSFPEEIPLQREMVLKQSQILYSEEEPLEIHDLFEGEGCYCESVRSYADKSLVRASFFRKDLLVFYSEINNGILIQEENFYSETDRLTQTIHKEDGLMSYTVFFYRNPFDDTLALSRRIYSDGTTEDSLFSESFLYEKGKFISGEVSFDLENELSEAKRIEGNLVISSTGTNGLTTEKTLNEKGETIKICVYNQTELISCEDFEISDTGEIVSSVKTEGEKVTTSEYEDGELVRQEEVVSGILMQTNEYRNSIRTQTLFEFGVPYAIVEYDQNTGKIKKVSYC